MALRDHEQRQLAAIEEHLADEDPNLAWRLANLDSSNAAPSLTTDPTLVMLGMYLAGVTAAVAGDQMSSPLVTALGVAMTVIFPLAVGWWLCRPNSTAP